MMSGNRKAAPSRDGPWAHSPIKATLTEITQRVNAVRAPALSIVKPSPRHHAPPDTYRGRGGHMG